MARLFDKNMFIMLIAIMMGVILITYFVADIQRRQIVGELETEIAGKNTEIKTITAKNINFTNHFMKSSALLDAAREDRAFGDYHFDLAFLWYNTAVTDKNINNSEMDNYKNMIITNCSKAGDKYVLSHQNFFSANDYFIQTKNYTNYDKYLEVLDLYIGLTNSGAKLTMLRYNASKHLKNIGENITVDEIYTENVTELLELFNETVSEYNQVVGEYNEYKEEIDEYDFIDEIR